MKIAILAVQGAFIEHRKVMESLNAKCVELRKGADWSGDFDGIILPGGESTVQGKLMKELGLFEPVKKAIEQGIPVLATCAGLILLAEHIVNDEKVYLQTLPVEVKRNAYGRQLGSFYVKAQFADKGEVPMTFIRAPYVVKAGEDVEVLAKVENRIVAVRYENQLGLAFHPELSQDLTIHKMFFDMVKNKY